MATRQFVAIPAVRFPEPTSERFIVYGLDALIRVPDDDLIVGRPYLPRPTIKLCRGRI